MRTTAHGRAIGAAIGNPKPDPTSLPGILRRAGVLLQYGDLETQIGIQSDPLATFKRDRGSARLLTTFSHESDAERHLLISARPELVSEPWDAAPDRYTWPEGVDADEAASELTVTWRSEDELHRVVTRAVGERRNVCMTAWVRDVPIEELLERAARMCDETEAIPKKVLSARSRGGPSSLTDQRGLPPADANLLGPFVGNAPPDPSSVPGLKRDER